MTNLTPEYDAVVIGSGPNGLAAGIRLAHRGLSVLILEAAETAGGGVRSGQLTLPGFTHDICSAVHPLAVSSPFFRMLPLEDHGLKWIYPKVDCAHPFDDGSAVFLENSVDYTADALLADSKLYRKIMSPLVRNWDQLISEILAPLHIPSHPFPLLNFGYRGQNSVVNFSQRHFNDYRTCGLFAGLAAHSILPLEKPLTLAVGLVLAAAGHAVGWPFPEGGSQYLARALISYFKSLGGSLITSNPVKSFNELPKATVYLFDVTPKQLLEIVGDKLPERYQKKLRKYRYGPGVFKVDWALDSPIPFKSKPCLSAGTVHIGGTMEEVAESERAVWQGRHSEKPFIILAQPSLFDTTRAPAAKHTAWAYCHVPNGSTQDMTQLIENQIERFAPGFHEVIIERHTMFPAQLEKYNANYIGGDINGGVQDWRQLFSRPANMFSPYSTPVTGVYLCSSSTPPGGGVHGMCGYYAAHQALKDCF